MEGARAVHRGGAFGEEGAPRGAERPPRPNAALALAALGTSPALRADGRSPLEFRPLSLAPAAGALEGGFAVEAELGATRALGCCSAELGEPSPGRPAEGSLEVRVELSPMASGAFEPGRGRPAQAEAEARLTRLLERSLRERRAVELESLCESPGRCAWALRLDVRVLDHGGALADAVAAAALAALLAFRLPQVSREPGGAFRAHPLEEREGRPLTVHRLPVAVSFAALQNVGGRKILLADPSVEEEALFGGARAVFSVDNARQVTVHAGGGGRVWRRPGRAFGEGGGGKGGRGDRDGEEDGGGAREVAGRGPGATEARGGGRDRRRGNSGRPGNFSGGFRRQQQR